MVNDALKDFLSEWNNDGDCVVVKTSGSTGTPKTMRVEKRRMVASAKKTIAALGLTGNDATSNGLLSTTQQTEITALLCLPLDFIAGKMMVVRAIVGGMRLITVEPNSHPLRSIAEAAEHEKVIPTFAAMVPMQVSNSLKEPSERDILARIPYIIIGGGAIDEALERELATFTNDIRSTYGMTETLSHIALRQLSRRGNNNDSDETDGWYTPLENVAVSLSADGCLVIDAPDVCSERLITNDIAELHADGRRFRILGRRDNVICSGGIKIQIEEVEQLLQSHIDRPFLITRCPDSLLGECVAMLVEERTMVNEETKALSFEEKTVGNDALEDARQKTIDALKAICESVLPKYFRPRRILFVDSLPLTETGKPARKKAEQIAKQQNTDSKLR